MFYEGDLGLGEANILENLNLFFATHPDTAFNMRYIYILVDIFWSQSVEVTAVTSVAGHFFYIHIW
jgi:hypothetical protein